MPKGVVLEVAEPPVTMFGGVPPTCPVCPPTETDTADEADEADLPDLVKPTTQTGLGLGSAAAPWLGMKDGKPMWCSHEACLERRTHGTIPSGKRSPST